MDGVRVYEERFAAQLTPDQFNQMRVDWTKTFDDISEVVDDLRADQITECRRLTDVATPHTRARIGLEDGAPGIVDENHSSEVENPPICTVTCHGRPKSQVDAALLSYKANLIASVGSSVKRFPVFSGMGPQLSAGLSQLPKTLSYGDITWHTL